MDQEPGCIYTHPGLLPTAPFPDMREAILREIEKERIRAQTIMSEITKMHVLEAEMSKEIVQVDAADHRVSEVKPVTKNGEEEEKIILVANPDSTISGSKSKAVTPPVADTSKRPSDSILYEKAEVIGTSESALKEHLCEKKHKFKEASLKPQSSGKNSTIGKFASEIMLLKKTELLENLKPDNFIKDQVKTIQSAQKNGVPKKTIYSFWCEMCQVGTFSEKVMHGHEMGKKHLKRQKGRAQNGETGPSNQKEKMEVPVNCVQHVSEGGKNVFLENVDVFLGETGFDLHKPLNAYDNGSHEQDENKAGGMDIIKTRDKSNLDAISPKDGVIIVKGEWSCDLCQVIATSESALNEHLCKKKHKLEEDSLCPGKNSNTGKIVGDTMLLKKTELENPKPDNFMKDQEKTIRSVHKNGDPKKTIYSFWCEMCQVGTSSEGVMSEHEKGKKHVKRLNDIVQHGETGPFNNEEKIEVPMNCVKHISEGGKSIFSHNVDVVSDEARLELHKLLDASNNGFETLPHQIGVAEVSMFKPVTKNGKDDEKIILLANHDVNIDGSKWNAVTPPPVADTSNPKEKIEVPVNCVQHVYEGGKSIYSENVDASDKGSHKPKSKAKEDGRAVEVTEQDETKVGGADIVEAGDESTIDVVVPEDGDIISKGEWSSDLCQVAATTISALIEFLLGRKQKSKEASMKTTAHEMNSSIGKIAADALLLNKPELLENMKSDNYIKDQLKTIQIVQKNGDLKKPNDSFWPEKFQVGNSSEKVMNDHEKGKKLKEIVQNGEIEQNKEKYGKSILSHNVDVVSAEAKLEHHKPFDASDNGFETLPIQIGASDLRVSEVKPVTKNGKQKKIILMGNPDANISGSKCKAVTPPVADTSKHPSGNILYKKAEGERSCVNNITTSESALNEHLCEKNYKLKEASLKPKSPGKNSSIGKISHDTLLFKKTELLVNPKSDNFKHDQAKTIQSVQQKDNPIRTNDSFWPKKCQVQTYSDKVVNDDEKGRKHVKRLKEIVQNGETGPCNQKEKIGVPVNCFKHISEGEKTIFPHNVNLVLVKGRLELDKSLGASDSGSHKQDQTKAACVNVIKLGDKSTFGAVLPKDSVTIAKGELSCALCQVTVSSKSSLNQHLRGKKHKWKQASLKAQIAGDTLSKKTEFSENPKSDNIKKEYAKKFRSVRNNGELKKTQCSSWRGIRQVGPSLEKVMNNHEKGMKHVMRIQESVQNNETGPFNQDKMEVPVNCVKLVPEGRKSIFSEFSGVDILELHKQPLDASDNGSHERVDKQNKRRGRRRCRYNQTR